MDIHPPTGKVESIKAYLIHLSMVVFGILIALGLDGWREARREHSLVEHSTASLRLEIEANKAELERVIRLIDEARKTFKTGEDAVDAAIQRKIKKQPAPKDEGETFHFDFDTPTLTSGAWQTAVATQAIAHMDYSQARAWGALYADQDDLRPFQNELVDAIARFLAMGSVDESDDLQRLLQYRDIGREIRVRTTLMQQNWKSLLKHYDQTLEATNEK